MIRIYRNIRFFLSFLAFLSLFCVPAFSNSNDGNPMGRSLESREMIEAINKIKDFQKDIYAIRATVYQKKKNPLLKKDIATEGTIILKKPNLLHWDITSPDKLTTIIDGKMMWVYHPDLKEVQRYSISEQYMAMQAVEFLLSIINMSVEDIGKRFDVFAYKQDNNLIFEMKAKSSMVARYLSAIYIWYREGEGVPYKFEVIGKKGDIATTEFRDVELNPPIKEKTFYFDIPAGVTITNTENEGRSY